jgi:hypothetical protein
VAAFQAAFGMIVAWSALAALLLSATRETRCRQSA